MKAFPKRLPRARPPSLPLRSKPTPTSSSTPPPRPSPPRRQLRITPSSLLDLVLIYGTAGICTYHLCMLHVVSYNYPVGPSMLPTLPVSDSCVLINRLQHRRGAGIRVGDLVSFRHPTLPGEHSLKRVIGMPGDLVLRDTPRAEWQDGQTGEAQEEAWMVRVPEGHCWVMGDNMNCSRDSRMFGALPLALIRGRVVARLWPDFKWFGREEAAEREQG